MDYVRPKKHLGQHFLKEKSIAERIASSITFHQNYKTLLEIGPGTGMLTQFLEKTLCDNLLLVEVDRESIAYLKNNFQQLEHVIIEEDFLKLDFKTQLKEKLPIGVVGNFPYNISSQIVFKVLENRQDVPEVVGMFQKEVAERIVAANGSKIYGILSVLTQAFYKTEYLFTVSEGVFLPPPKVKSAVIRLTRKDDFVLPCDEALFFDVVKTGFNQRRKTLRNALSKFGIDKSLDILNKRAEQLTVDDFVFITKVIQKNRG